MTNYEIIASAAITAGIFTRDEVIAFHERGQSIPLHTFAEWKSRGYIVKRGERAAMKCRIWKHRAAQERTEDNGEVVTIPERWIMVDAYFFKREQVEAV